MKYPKDKNISWDKDMKLSRKEIIVGKICPVCNEMINDNMRLSFHRECYKKIRCERHKKVYREKIRKDYPPKYCIDCNVLLPKEKWNKPLVKRCDLCQIKFNRKGRPEYDKERYKNRREITIAVTCIICGEIIPTKSTNRKYCHRHTYSVVKKDKDKRKVDREKYKRDMTKKYLNKNKTISDSRERLGTYQTSNRFKQYPVEKLVKDKEGNPDFEKEREQIDRLKNKTYNPRNQGYSKTEGDRKRNLRDVDRGD